MGEIESAAKLRARKLTALHFAGQNASRNADASLICRQ
jgi:hypothetical protein